MRRAALVLVLSAAGLCGAPPAAAQPDPAAPPARAADGGRFVLAAVDFRGNTVLSTPELQALAAPDIGREVALPELEALAARVTAAYRARGYFLAQALVPQQRIQDGRVEISVLEGRLGQVQLRLAADAPIAESHVRAILARLPPGQPLRQDSYERTMLLLSDLPGLKVQSGLEQGADTGATDLVVEIGPDGRRWSGSVGADDYGTPAVGEARASVSLRYASPLGLGDDADLRLMTSDNTNQTFGRLAYEAPVGADGLRIGAGLARVNYQLGAQFAPLDASGVADIADVSAGYPVLRSRGRNAFLRFGGEFKRLEDVTGAVGLRSDKRVTAFSLGATWESRDELLGGGYVNGGFTWRGGRLAFKDAAALAIDQDPAVGRRTAGDFTKLSLQGSRLQALFGPNNLYLSFAGQWADRNLDPSEQMGLGGDGAVRAYSSDEVLVDTGGVASAEWRFSVNERLVAAAFFDVGIGVLSQDPAPGAVRNERALRGAGLGLTWDAPWEINVRGALAWRLGVPPQVDAGRDQPRVLVQLQKGF